MEELGAELSLRRMRGQEFLRGNPFEHHWKKDPRGKSLARDLSRSTLGEVGTIMSAGEVHTVSPLGMGAAATPLLRTRKRAHTGTGATSDHNTDTTRRDYIHTFIHSYIYTFIHTFIHSYIHTFIHSYVHTFIHS